MRTTHEPRPRQFDEAKVRKETRGGGGVGRQVRPY